jgi:hypothetical protein
MTRMDAIALLLAILSSRKQIGSLRPDEDTYI